MADVDRFRIDGHKLHLHPRRVADWVEGKNIAPLYIEASPSGACNHRCRFCGLDFMGYQPRFLPTDIFCCRLEEMGSMGVKAIMYAGEGEPFLHRDMIEIAQATKRSGIDVAFTTNAVLFSPEKAHGILPVTSWIKVSCNAGDAATYAAIHGTKEADFERVMDNMAAAVRLRSELGSACTLGFQMVLLPENRKSVAALAERVRDMGADYLVVKPYSQHPQGLGSEYASVRYEDMAGLAKELACFNTDSFRIVCREETARRHDAGEKGYGRCLALPFWSYIDAGCTVWGCSMFLENDRFAYGNLKEMSFAEIWNGSRRQESLAWCARHLDATSCRLNCRMDAINLYLHELRNPGAHASFI